MPARLLALLASAVLFGCLPMPRPPPPPEVRTGPPRIQVQSATWAANCKGHQGNDVRAVVQRACDGKAICDFRIEHSALGQAPVTCPKTLDVAWSCGPTWSTDSLSQERAKDGGIARLNCLPYDAADTLKDRPAPPFMPGVPNFVQILGATFGKNCGEEPGNDKQRVHKICEQKTRCTVTVDPSVVATPVPACPHDYVVHYSCLFDGRHRQKGLKAASAGAQLLLECP
jgi:hypothetical protein